MNSSMEETRNINAVSKQKHSSTLTLTFLQEDLRIALRQGHDILKSIGTPILDNPMHKMNSDQVENQATVDR